MFEEDLLNFCWRFGREVHYGFAAFAAEAPLLLR